MAQVKIGAGFLRGQIPIILRHLAGGRGVRCVVLQFDAIQCLAIGVIGIKQKVVRHSLRGSDLQPVIRRVLVGPHDKDLTEGTGVDGPPGEHTGTRTTASGWGNRARSWIVHIHRERKVVAQCPHVCHGDTEVPQDLPLDGKIELVRIGPLEIRRHT